MKMIPELLLIMFVIMPGCSHAPEEAPPKTVVTVRTARARAEDIKLTVQAPATIFPREQANISARITAPIRALRVRKGDRVATGQVVAVLESGDIAAQRQEAAANLADAQANLRKTSSGTLPTEIGRAKGQLDMAQAALNQARKNYDRRNQLFKQGAIPERDLLVTETDLAQAKTAYDVARKSLDLLQNQSGQNDIQIAQSRVAQAKAKEAYANAQLQYTDLRSPLSGTATEQFMYPGDMAKPDLPIFTVMDLSNRHRARTGSRTAGRACADGSGMRLFASGRGAGRPRSDIGKDHGNQSSGRSRAAHHRSLVRNSQQETGASGGRVWNRANRHRNRRKRRSRSADRRAIRRGNR